MVERRLIIVQRHYQGTACGRIVPIKPAFWLGPGGARMSKAARPRAKPSRCKVPGRSDDGAQCGDGRGAVPLRADRELHCRCSRCQRI
jgi:hypothetical protein